MQQIHSRILQRLGFGAAWAVAPTLRPGKLQCSVGCCFPGSGCRSAILLQHDLVVTECRKIEIDRCSSEHIWIAALPGICLEVAVPEASSISEPQDGYQSWFIFHLFFLFRWRERSNPFGPFQFPPSQMIGYVYGSPGGPSRSCKTRTRGHKANASGGESPAHAQ
jgi:hypothetical protein